MRVELLDIQARVKTLMDTFDVEAESNDATPESSYTTESGKDTNGDSDSEISHDELCCC